MSDDLRAYQARSIAAVGAALRGGARAPISQGPTGCGKTRMAAHMAAALARPRPGRRLRRILFLVHRRELRAQMSGALGALGIEHGTIAPGHPWIARQIQVASVFCVANLLAKLDARGWAPDTIFVDECHHAAPGSTWWVVLGHWPRAVVIGLTATPRRLDGAPLGVAAGGFFDRMILGPSPRELVRAGHLAPVELLVPGRLVDAGGVPVRNGDYVRAELSALCNRPEITGCAIEHYRLYGQERPGIAFCADVAHAETVAEQFRAAGYRCAAVYGESRSGSGKESRRGLSGLERARRLADLADGKLHLVTTCNLLEEGVDVPVAAVALFLSHTLSVVRWLQRIGRVRRTHPGKPFALALDHVGISRKLGSPDKDWAWSLDDVPAEAGGDAALDQEPAERTAKGAGGGAPRVWPTQRPGQLIRAEEGPDGELVPAKRQLEWALSDLRSVREPGMRAA